MTLRNLLATKPLCLCHLNSHGEEYTIAFPDRVYWRPLCRCTMCNGGTAIMDVVSMGARDTALARLHANKEDATDHMLQPGRCDNGFVSSVVIPSQKTLKAEMIRLRNQLIERHNIIDAPVL